MPQSKKSAALSSSGGHNQAEPWPEQFISLAQLDPDQPIELKRIVNAALDERPVQKYCEQNPAVLLPFLGGVDRGWVFGRPKLGAEFVPDFMLSCLDSGGYHWHLIELENPTYTALTQQAAQNARLTHAVQQILDWRIWLRRNIQYAQVELGYRDLDAEFESSIVMGRRKEMTRSQKDRYRELSRDRIRIMTYDRFLERIATIKPFSPKK
ncbi:MAG: Shedu anti-phage system protein SduA domain-containing protein [Pyrinomonadaceae bacterium]